MKTKKTLIFLICFAATFSAMFVILSFFVFSVKLSFWVSPLYFITESLKKAAGVKFSVSFAAGAIAATAGVKITKKE